MPVQVKATHHIGVIVPHLDVALRAFARLFGSEPAHQYVKPGIKAAMFELADGTEIEFMEFAPDSDQATRMGLGPVIHHVALEVDDVDAALATLAAEGVELWSTESRPGLSVSKAGFISATADLGITIEICQK